MIIDPKDRLRLNHIVEASNHIADFVRDVTEEEFSGNYEKQSAVIRQFEIIGEAASKLSSEFTEQNNQIDWPKVVGMRHKMIHDYFDVDTKIVWATAIDDAVPLKEAIKKILADR